MTNNNIYNNGTYYIRYNNTINAMEFSNDQINYTQTDPTIAINISGSDISGSIIIKIISDIQINNNNYYFVLKTDNITIDGQNHTFYINNVTNYAGLIRYNVPDFTISSNIFIQNIHIDSQTSSLLFSGAYPNITAGGWIGQTNFRYGIFNNCSSNGPINNYCGGIIGNLAGQDGNITISNCYSSGNIGESGGGILGERAGELNNNVPQINTSVIIMRNCYSTGNIGTSGGGIFGSQACHITDSNDCNATINVYNCYSTGNIGSNGGGIFGENSGSGYGNNNTAIINAYRCYSTGNIGSDGGGIFGKYCSYGVNITNININTYNCYSTGIISSGGGGIFGSSTCYTGNVNARAENCYFNGNSNQLYGDGSTSGKITGINILTINDKL